MSSVYQKGSQIWLNVGNTWYWYDERLDPLGSGAMGTVYLGREHQSGMRVAIKRVADRFSNVPSIRARARQEAEMQFCHPNLVEMLGYCEWQEHRGPIFIISNFVPGITIDQFINETNILNRPDGVARVLNLMFPIMDALEYIHSHNILHLDIKPSNIMVENGKNVRLMDLGIAQAETSFDISSAGLLGTPGYAAPEQYIENGASVTNLDYATDVYELGATIYELLGGIKSDISSNNIPDIQGVSKPIMRVLRKSLSPSKEERWQRISDFRLALRQALAQPKPCKKWIIPTIIGIILIIVMVVTIIISQL